MTMIFHGEVNDKVNEKTKRRTKNDISEKYEKRREENELKKYRRLTIAFELNDTTLLEGLQLLSKKNRRAVGSEIKLMLENKLLEEGIIERDEDYNIYMKKNNKKK